MTPGICVVAVPAVPVEVPVVAERPSDGTPVGELFWLLSPIREVDN